MKLMIKEFYLEPLMLPSKSVRIQIAYQLT